MMSPALADVFGRAEVIDGDTLLVGGQPVRLYGIDAPELEQECRWPKSKVIQCGEIAKSAILDMVAGVDRISCKTMGRNNHGHWIAVCYAGGFDIGRNMVHTGWALADRNRSLHYVRTEHGAKNARRGLWKGDFDPPWLWRRNH